MLSATGTLGHLGLVIQERDLSILRFCLEMRFACVETLDAIFFKTHDSTLFAARKRLARLESNGLLKGLTLAPGSLRKYYVVTAKGHRECIRRLDASQAIPNPITKLSLVTFEHDLGVLNCRLELERQGRATSWRSERVLKFTANMITGELRREFMPDAIFTSKQGKICAFEFENRPKSESQLREKIGRLKAHMSSNERAFDACLIIASSLHLKKRIQTITDLYPAHFVVQSLSELLNSKEGLK